MEPGFIELANGNFASGLKLLNQDDQWHDDNNVLQGPFRLGFPRAQGWGEDLLVASLLRRSADAKSPIKVFSKYWQVCSILKQDPAFDPSEDETVRNGRPPLAVLIHALTSDLLTSEFIPLSTSAQAARPQDQRPRIGIVWASIDKNHIKQKSVPVKEFLNTLAGVEADFVSLQRKLEVADPECLLNEFGAEIIPGEVLDAQSVESLSRLVDEILKVTVSTTTTHIAASMGIQVELIAAERNGPQWFWQAQANHHKCFYPSVTVHLGQGKSGKWWERSLESARASLPQPLDSGRQKGSLG